MPRSPPPLVETGYSWFNGGELLLPDGTRFEFQIECGAIGWSVGATLGCALGKSAGRVIAWIGDGSFQVGAQELSMMLRYATNPMIFRNNDGGYTIEAEIHDAPYNRIKNWDDAKLVEVFGAGEGNGWSTRVAVAGELHAAIAKPQQSNGVCLIEVMIERDDCNVKLLRRGNLVAHNYGRPPRHL